jgi:hypothetical protein
VFRSLNVFVFAACMSFSSQFVSQPTSVGAGELSTSVHRSQASDFDLSRVSVPQIFAPRIPVADFPHPLLTSRRPSARLPRVNGFRFKYSETYGKWRSVRQELGNPLDHETSVVSSRIQGSWMRFERGYIVRHTSGRTFIVRGGIGRAWVDQGGVYGRLGFPQGNEYELNAQGHDAQAFQFGLIFWNPKLNKFVVGPSKA